MINENETIALVQATQDGKNLEDTHPISRLIKWTIANGQSEDFDIGCVRNNLEYAISQLEAANSMIKLVCYVRNNRG